MFYSCKLLSQVTFESDFQKKTFWCVTTSRMILLTYCLWKCFPVLVPWHAGGPRASCTGATTRCQKSETSSEICIVHSIVMLLMHSNRQKIYRQLTKLSRQIDVVVFRVDTNDSSLVKNGFLT